MKRLLFVVLLCGLATAPSLGASSLGFWEEGTPGSIHLVWSLEPDNVTQIQVPGGQSFDVDTSQEAVFPEGALSKNQGHRRPPVFGRTIWDGARP